MDPTIVIQGIISLAAAVSGVAGGIFLGRKRAVADIRAEVNQATRDLIDVLKEQLQTANAEIAQLKPKLTIGLSRIEWLELEIERLERRAIQLYERIDQLERIVQGQPPRQKRKLPINLQTIDVEEDPE